MRDLILIIYLATNFVYSFVVLPYIQIDYAHLFRLAQCKAKCSEKYSSPKTRELLDGTIDEYFSVDNEDYEQCQLGCIQFQHRRDVKKTNLTGPLLQGAKFWMKSSAHTGRVGSSPIISVELLCQMPSATSHLDDTFEGLIGMRKPRPSGPVHYVVQWKQRTNDLGSFDETQWISASVEPDTIFKVDGLIPGVQYKFLITAIGPAGKLGDTLQSEWVEISPVLQLKTPGAPLVVKNGYNPDHGVMAQLHFPRTAYDSCNFRLELKNSTTTITKDVQVDPTHSILLPNLEFDSSYTIKVAALSADKAETSSLITARFTSFQCQQVHGKGSLQCAPEAVTNLRVSVRSNWTALISWTPSSDLENILTYELTYQGYIGPCSNVPVTVYLDADSESYEILLPPNQQCEFMVRVTNYDAIGRESFAETKIVTLGIKFQVSSLKVPVLVFVLSFAILVAAILIIAICRCCQKIPVKVSENKTKLADIEFA